MKLKSVALIIMAIIASFTSSAQDFVQPYPAGNAMKGNPNFIGTAYLYPMSDVKELNVPMFSTVAAGCQKTRRPRQTVKHYWLKP
mgnify:CR=1 FL=1